MIHIEHFCWSRLISSQNRRLWGHSPRRLKGRAWKRIYSCYGYYHTKRTTQEDKSMAYSVMVWLVEPGEQAHQEEAMQRTTTGRANAPGAASGVNEPPAFTRMVYGVYESLEEAKKALSAISNTLRDNEPLQITSGVMS